MEKEIAQLMDMGATRAQARAALRKAKDVSDAAELIFSGDLDDVTDADDVPMDDIKPAKRVVRPHTPDEDEDEDEEAAMEEDDDEDMEEYDYEDDSIFDPSLKRSGDEIDPYAGIFFSKDRREEVIEVEEDPEYAIPSGSNESLPLMTQGEWMKGCPEGGEQSLLFGLWNDLGNETVPCPTQCGGHLRREKGMFFAIWHDFAEYTSHLRTVIQSRCPKCSQHVCLACGEPVSSPRNSAAHSHAQAQDPLFHCSPLQGLILGVGLSMVEKMFDEQVRAAKEGTSANGVANGSRKKRKVEGGKVEAEEAAGEEEEAAEEEYLFGLTSAPVGKSSGKRAPSGIGYGGASGKEDQAGILAAQAAQAARDTAMGTLLAQVRVFLPSLRRKPHAITSDYLPHPTSLAHLRRRFNAVSSALLRNDSLADMSERAVVYFELLEWLETVSNHEALASMMGMPIMVPASIRALTPKHSSGKKPLRERLIVYEGSSGPRELLEAVVIQARAALKGLESTGKKESAKEEMTEEEKRAIGANANGGAGKGKGKEKQGSGEDMKLFAFCDRIQATAQAIDRSLLETKGAAFLQRLHDSLPRIQTSAQPADALVSAPRGASDAERQAIYEDWARRVRFEYCDLTIAGGEGGEEVVGWKSVFSSEARGLASMDLPKRSLAIAKELAVLSTNMPVNWNSSVFLRVDETRVDVIKALITGPEGTPYENGCFLFDIFLGANYNQAPPSVKYLTTNGGQFRFNPNLYAEGKVCLSLLGTWQGPSWQPGKSTLLQVLISIQSMILCEEPYLNEPGWEGQRGTAASEAYSANVRRMVVHTAMMGNLKNPPEPFADVIRTHFRLKAPSIRAQLDSWLKKDDGHSYTDAYHGGGPGGVLLNKKKEKESTAAESSSSVMAKSVAELKALLKELEEETVA